jgi:hypothetical protein
MRRSDTTKAIERFLADRNITTYRFNHRTKHRVVIVTYGGRDIFVTIPTSSCNWRAPYYAVSNLRHALGLVGRVAS